MTDRIKTDDFSRDEERLSQAPPVSAARRRLVKGSAAAVPVVLTLRSGVAAALVSNQECVEKDRQAAALAPPEAIIEGNVPSDPWVRKLTRCRDLVQGTTILKKIFLMEGSVSTGDDKWLAEDNKADPRVFRHKNSNNMDVIENGMGNVQWSNDTDCLVLAHVLPADPMNPDPNTGAITRFGFLETTDMEFNPITVSCWCSINPNMNLPDPTI